MTLLINETKLDKDIYNTILIKFKDFIRETLTYVLEYINTYRKITDNMVVINNNLLYLYHLITYQLANYNTDIDKLLITYDKLKKILDVVIKQYEEFQNKLIDNTNSYTSPGPDPNILALIKRLEERIALLDVQKTKLSSNLKEIDAKIFKYEKLASKEAVDVLKKIKPTNIKAIEYKKIN